MLVVLLMSLTLGCPVPPVDAAVVDPFRPPTCPWCPGNRGLEYGVRPGLVVRAVFGGEVVFAGEVAGERYVTVRISDGRRLTYGRLSRLQVSEGQRVGAGQPVGRTSDEFILTVRRGEQYEDPAPLLEPPTRPRLVRADGQRRPPGRALCRAPATRWGTTLTLR